MENFSKYINLLDRYYRGETSAEEEAMLRSAIRSGEIEEDSLERYYRSKWDAAGDSMDEQQQKRL